MDLAGIVVRDMGRAKPHDVAFRFEVLRALASRGIYVVNSPEAIAQAANKFATSAALRKAGVPTPRTIVTSSIDDALDALIDLGRAVYKPLFGYKGRGIALLTDKDESALRALMASQGLVYLQEFVGMERPRDIRAFVVGDKVIGAIYRLAPEGAWISNLARGGFAEPCPPTKEMANLAVKASRAIGATYSGVDLLETDVGLKVIEVNGTPSGKGIYDALGVDVTGCIADNILKTIHRT